MSSVPNTSFSEIIYSSSRILQTMCLPHLTIACCNFSTSKSGDVRFNVSKLFFAAFAVSFIFVIVILVDFFSIKLFLINLVTNSPNNQNN